MPAAEVLGSWWETDIGEAHLSLPDTIDSLLTACGGRMTEYVRFASMYGNGGQALSGGSFLCRKLPGAPIRRLTFNVIKSCIDTVVNARASEYGPLQAQSHGGDFRQFWDAKRLTEGLRNAFTTQQVELKTAAVVKDACVFGNGIFGVAKELDHKGRQRPKVFRQFTPELITDPYECTTDEWPDAIQFSRFVDRQALCAQYPDHVEAIMRASRAIESAHRVRQDDIRLDVGYIVSRGGQTGRHVICVEGVTLKDVEFDYPTHNFVNLAYSPPFQGIYAQGLADELLETQFKITEIIDIISDAHDFFGDPMMFVEETSNVQRSHLQAIPGKVISYLANPPSIPQWNIVAPELYNWVETLFNKAYQISGVSQLQSVVQNPQRLESSKAMRASTDISDTRHFTFADRCETTREELGALYVRVAVECADKNDYLERMPMSASFQEMNWRDFKQDLDNYKITIGTVNALETTIAENLQDIQDVLNLGELTQTQFLQYMQNPDVMRMRDMSTAQDDYIDFWLYKLAFDDDVDPADRCTFTVPGVFFKATLQYYLIGMRCDWRGAHEEARTRFENLLSELKGEIDKGLSSIGQSAGPGAALPPGTTGAQAQAASQGASQGAPPIGPPPGTLQPPPGPPPQGMPPPQG